MQGNVFFLSSLRRDVTPYLSFAAMTTYGTNVISVRPEFSSPEVLFDRRHSEEDLSGCNAFERPDNLGRAVRWNGLNEEVNVISIGADFQESEVIAHGNLKTNIPERLIHVCREDCPPVLCGAHDMVQQHGDVVAAMDVLTHTPSIPYAARQAAGNLPEEIEPRFQTSDIE